MLRAVAAGLFLLVASLPTASAQDIRRLSLAATWSIERAGLLNALVLAFQTETGIRVQFTPAGETQPFEAGRQGSVDALLVADPVETQRFIDDGFGVEPQPALYTDFVLVGPEADPARCRDLTDVVEALRRIAEMRQRFLSRGDGSVTHQREAQLWRDAGIDLTAAERSWYRPLGTGARATLEAAVAERAYVLVSRLAWVRLKSPHPLRVMVHGDARLVATVSSVRVNSERFEFVHGEEAKAWHAWVLSPAAQAEIAAFRMDGHQVYFPIASMPRGAPLVSPWAPPLDQAAVRPPFRLP
jgi:tungstate transport system substrate-binding protein